MQYTELHRDSDRAKEHKKKHPDASVNFSEFSKKCSEKWKTMFAKEKRKFEDKTKVDKTGKTKKKFKDPSAPKKPPSAFFLFCSEYCPQITEEYCSLPTGNIAKKLGEMQNNIASDDKQHHD
ncbi:hypothetical protein GH733_005913 [Mirounga leonina]|nr:hypothetical protein GH733_005913 [Mirounga leonina]